LGSERYVRIIATPLGDAPEWVRRGWVGLELPVLDPEPITTQTSSVLPVTPTTSIDPVTGVFRIFNGPKIVTGYLAPVDACIAILADAHPKAAEWWRLNTPHLLNCGKSWIFDESACQLIPLASEPD